MFKLGALPNLICKFDDTTWVFLNNPKAKIKKNMIHARESTPQNIFKQKKSLPLFYFLFIIYYLFYYYYYYYYCDE
jgi:hypothetical protein